MIGFFVRKQIPTPAIKFSKDNLPELTNFVPRSHLKYDDEKHAMLVKTHSIWIPLVEGDWIIRENPLSFDVFTNEDFHILFTRQGKVN